MSLDAPPVAVHLIFILLLKVCVPAVLVTESVTLELPDIISAMISSDVIVALITFAFILQQLHQ